MLWSVVLLFELSHHTSSAEISSFLACPCAVTSIGSIRQSGKRASGTLPGIVCVTHLRVGWLWLEWACVQSLS